MTVSRREEMDMDKHTPGPWRSSSVNGRDYHITAGKPGLARIFATVNCPLHYTPSYPTLNPDSRRETEANARLIAAAPSLIAALEALVFYDTFEEAEPILGTREHEVVSAARAAIAKAKGGE
jgi:hypothetical protein